MPGTEAVRPGTGFCGDCQTFAIAMGNCGGTFTEADMSSTVEYVLQQKTATCVCTSVLQKILWTCAKCMANGGVQAKAPPPQKYQTQCMTWGTSIEQWKADYTGPVADGTTTSTKYSDSTDPNPNPNPNPVTSVPPQPTTANPQPTGGNGNNPTPSNGAKVPGGDNNNSGNGNDPNNSLDGGQSTSQSSSGLNTTAVAVSGGIIGVALIAGALAVVMMKRRRRRHTPLDLDSLPGGGGFITLEDKWEKPTSPGLPPAPVASAGPMVGNRHRGQAPYDERYMEGGSAVGGYEPHYDNYDHYRGGPGSANGYDDYGHYPSQFGAEQQQHYVGYHPNHGQESHDYGYEKGNNGSHHQQGETGNRQYL